MITTSCGISINRTKLKTVSVSHIFLHTTEWIWKWFHKTVKCEPILTDGATSMSLALADPGVETGGGGISLTPPSSSPSLSSLPSLSVSLPFFSFPLPSSSLLLEVQYNTIQKIFIERDYTEMSRGANKTWTRDYTELSRGANKTWTLKTD